MSAGDDSPSDEPVLRWTVHPAAHDRARAMLVLAVIALAGLLAYVLSHSALLAAAGTGLLLASLRAFFLPRTYVLDARGAREEGPLAAARTLPWSEVRVVSRVRHGVHLAPLHLDRRWHADRGLFLRTDGNAERVAAFALAQTAPQTPA
jgi:hypothetical protein